MKITQAVALHVANLKQPVISSYELAMFIFNLFVEKKYNGQTIEISNKDLMTTDAIKRVVDALTEFGIVKLYKDFAGEKVYGIIGKKDYSVGDVACSVDPFAYVSHISAMDYHGLTDRIPKILYISSPPARKWSEFARDKMQKDCKASLNEYFKYNLPKLTKTEFGKIEKYPVVKYSSIHRGAFKKVEGRSIRVSTLGRTFLDMVREPDYCGGMRHVAEVYRDNGAHYKKLIISEIDRHGKLIEQSRAGYLLEEVCNIKDGVIDKWAERVKRGGSRKLDPKTEYRSTYSERWCLSINTDLDGIV